MSEQITIYHEDGSVTIIATMTPVSPEEREVSTREAALQPCGLQLIEEEEERKEQ